MDNRRGVLRVVGTVARVNSGPVATAVLVSVVLAFAGCTAPDPAPTPTATGFTSDEAAFAAAEATYRAYVDALNQVDLADPSTFEPVFALTTGEANANDRESFSRLHADGAVKSGETVIIAFRWNEPKRSVGDTTATACVDVSANHLRGPSGSSLTNPERPPRYALTLTFAPDPLPRVEKSIPAEDPSCG